MKHEAKLWRPSRLHIAKHGKRAARVAHERARDRLDKRDYRVSSMWACVADIIMGATGARQSRLRDEPSLHDILDSPATKAVMDADNIDRDHVETVMNEVKEKRGRRR